MTSYLITGSARGLGLALVSQILSLPSTTSPIIFATSRSLSPGLSKIIESSSGKVVFVELDATNEGSIKKALSEVESKIGDKGLDILINNAGIMSWTQGKTDAMTDLQQHLSTNVIAVQNVTSAFLPLLKKGSLKKVANISTTLGSISRAKDYQWGSAPAYKISKAALNMLTVQYALDYAGEGFTFIAVTPGWLKTDLGGDGADLPVETGAKATLDKIIGATNENNGQFLNIHVKGWEKVDGPNFYDGANVPW